MKKIIALVLSLILVFSSMSVVFVSASAEETTEPTNYAPSGWQAGAHWYNNGGRISETEDSHFGGKGFNVSNGSSAYQFVDATDTITLMPNTDYRFFISVKGLTAETKGKLEKLLVYTGGAKEEAGSSESFPATYWVASISNSVVDATSNNEWIRLCFDFTTNSSTTYDLRLKWADISSFTISDIALYAKANTAYEIEGNGKVVSSESATYLGQTVVLTAVPDNGEAFIGWYNGEVLLSNSTAYNYTISSDNTNVTAKFTSSNVSLMDETKWGISARDTNASITKADDVISVNDIQWNFFYIPMSLKSNTTYELVFDVKSQIQLEKFRICPKSCGVGYKDDGDHQHGAGSAAILYKDSGNEPLNSFVDANTWYENNVITFTTNSTETDYYIIIKTGSNLSGATSSTPMEFKNMYVRTVPDSYKIAQNSDKFKTQGRTTILNDLLMVDYAASGIEFNAECYGDVSVTFSSTYLPEGEGGGCYFTVIVDDEVMPRDFCHITNKGEVTVNIANDLTYGKHNFKIYRQSEMQYATIGIKSVNLKGELLDAPEQNDLYIEFVGASSTNGFGNLGTSDIKDQETAQLPIYQDATQAHAYLTAKALGADYSIVAFQGMGAKYTWQTTNMLTAYNYQRYLKDLNTLYDFEQRKPDIVVVELSGNDFTRANSFNTDSDPSNDVTEQQLIDGLVEMGTLIRAKNPDAKILWIAGSNGTNTYHLVSSAIETLGGAANNYFSLKVTSNVDGAKTHPSVAGHKVIAGEVTRFIAKNLLGNTFLTSAEVWGNGTTNASVDFAFEGDTVEYTAIADEEEYFLGWYVEDALVSANTKYSHTFTADGTKPTAKFTTYNLMKADLWKTSPRDTNATVELIGDTVSIKEIQWNFFYIPVHLKTNTYYSFDFNYRSQIKAEKLYVVNKSSGLAYDTNSGAYVRDSVNGELILYQDSTYGTNLKNFVVADTWYNNNSVTFKTNATDTDYYIIVKTAEQLSGATATTPVEFSNAAISESLKTAVILTDEKTGRKGNAAIRAASNADGGVAKNGLRIYNAINKQFITDNHIIEYGSIVIAADSIADSEALSLETEGIKQGLAFRKYDTENGLAKEALIWKEDGYKNVFTSYLTNIKAENYGREYLIRSYAISSTGAVFYGDVISACIYDVVYAIDNDENANEVSVNAFNIFVNKNRALYSSWCNKNGYQTGKLFAKDN